LLIFYSLNPANYWFVQERISISGNSKEHRIRRKKPDMSAHTDTRHHHDEEEISLDDNSTRLISPASSDSGFVDQQPMLGKKSSNRHISQSSWSSIISSWYALATEASTRPNWYSFISPQGKEYLQAIQRAKAEQTNDGTNRVATLYKFDVQNNSIMERYILNPFWNNIIERVFPAWLAPNVITLAGFLCVALSFILSTSNFYTYIIPGTTMPSAIYNIFLLVISVLVFCYNTLDGCDGKQARRTGSSSPLGEIFDHGVDALSATILPVTYLVAMGHTPLNFGTFLSDMGVLLVHVVMLFAFYTAHWEHHHTGSFYMGYASASDGQFAVIAVHLVAFIYNIFSQDTSLVGFYQLKVLGATIGFWILLVTMLASIASPLTSIYHVMQHYRQKSKSIDQVNNPIDSDDTIDLESGNQGRQFKQIEKNSALKFTQDMGNAMVDLLVLAIFLALYFSMTIISRSLPEDVAGYSFYQTNWIIIYVIGGLTFGVYLTTMNISRVSNQPYPRFTKQYVIMLLPIMLFILNGLTMVFSSESKPLINGKIILILNLVWSALFYAFFATSVVRECSINLGIYAFKLGTRVPALSIPKEDIAIDDEQDLESNSISNNGRRSPKSSTITLEESL